MRDWNCVREDFPTLRQTMRGRPLVYLDSAATAQKPASVIAAIREYYELQNCNVHRGAYEMSQKATDAYEAVRESLARFIGVSDPAELIFTSGTTESLNRVAHAWAKDRIGAGDTILVSRMEHHSNFVPWQTLALEKGAHFKIIELDGTGRIDMSHYRELLMEKPKIVALSWVSNVLGTINPVREMAELANRAGAAVVVDAAQAVGHMPVDLKALGPIDFFAFSAHKMFGPTGVGALWGRREHLEEMSPWLYGGNMILHVGDEQTRWNELPARLEAGTPHIEGVIGWGAALDYLCKLGMSEIYAYETELGDYALERLGKVEGLKVFGPSHQRAPVYSFTLEGVHPHDLATFLDTRGIAVRAGHHCAQPLARSLGVVATVRASLAFYNQKSEIDFLAEQIEAAQEYFSPKRRVRERTECAEQGWQ